MSDRFSGRSSATAAIVAAAAAILGAIIGATGIVVSTERTLASASKQQTLSDLRQERRIVYGELLRADAELRKYEFQTLRCWEDGDHGEVDRLRVEIRNDSLPAFLKAASLVTLIGSPEAVAAVTGSRSNHEFAVDLLVRKPGKLSLHELGPEAQETYDSMVTAFRRDLGIEPADSVPLRWQEEFCYVDLAMSGATDYTDFGRSDRNNPGDLSMLNGKGQARHR